MRRSVSPSARQTGRWPPNTSTKKPWSMPMKISMLGRFTATVHSADAGSAAIDKGGRLPLTETAMASGARWRGRRREKRFNSVQRVEAYPLRRTCSLAGGRGWTGRVGYKPYVDRRRGGGGRYRGGPGGYRATETGNTG